MQDFSATYRPHFTPAPRQQTIPDGIWRKCPGCGQMLYWRQLHDQHEVCNQCDYHFRLSAAAWIDLLLDPQGFSEYESQVAPTDPLAFHTAAERYADKLERTQKRLGQLDAVVCGEGTCGGMPLAFAVSDFRFLGGSMGSVYGEKIARAVEHAVERDIPLVTVSTSGGARMHEGIFSLMQMAKVAVALRRLVGTHQPHISILADPCYGGVTASYASLADVVLAEPGAHIGFAGPRVIEQTIRQQLPPQFQTAEFLLEHGMIDAIVPRSELRRSIERLLRIYASRIQSVGGGMGAGRSPAPIPPPAVKLP